VPERAVRGELPTPEQERKAVLALIAFTVLAILGAGAAMFAIAVSIGKLARWAFGW